ncbi:geranylgeranyl reductase family protein [Rubrobacter tropicus]|uniref:Geranylgeranyl reductase family protein n=1 Tax=Rubrobacter tropicus TaxID=2653851 RepID=A0A6G8QDY7_9ACTN|nr:geranylgeranyl reductase family protein [Rubrobacter tropicus]QIN84457.1 geranylgeranyl reductase family protein [Rubrobacter tropicus]
MADRADLVVVGAGPAGSSTAYHAARSGLSVLLLDRQEFPRDKTCGDGLMPHAVSEISLMGLSDWLSDPRHGRFRGFALHTQTADFKEPVPPSIHGPRGYVVPRIETDAALLERARKAGARFRGGVHVTEVARSADGRVAGVEAESNDDTSRFEAPLVVVADGSGGGLVHERKAHQNAVARRQYFRNVSGPDKDHLHIFATKELNERGAGYGWIFYLGDGRANVGAGLTNEALSRSSYTLQQLFDRFLKKQPVAEWLADAKPDGPARSWSLKMGMWGARRVGQGLMLVGDAGSMIHPISGEGVGYAIQSGRLAAAFAHEAHAKSDFSARLLSGYEKGLRREWALRYFSGRALVKALPNLAVLEPIFKASEVDRELRRTLIESFTGDASVFKLLKHPKVFASLVRERARKAG